MYTLVVLTKARGKVIASFEGISKALLKFQAYEMLTPYRRAVIFNGTDVDIIYELVNGVPKEVTTNYNVEVVTA